MAGRLDRFLNLEGARRPASADEPSNDLQPGEPAGDPEAVLQARREAQLKSGLALDENWEEEQHFVRCGQCGTDSNRNTVRCPTCSAELDTPMQRAFNEALWKKKRAEMIVEKTNQPSPSAATAGADASLAEQQRALGEMLAREVQKRESGRLDWMGGGSDESLERPLGQRLLSSIPSQRARVMVTMGIVSIGGSLFWQGLLAHQGRNPFLLLPLIALIALFIPRRRPGGFDNDD